MAGSQGIWEDPRGGEAVERVNSPCESAIKMAAVHPKGNDKIEPAIATQIHRRLKAQNAARRDGTDVGSQYSANGVPHPIDAPIAYATTARPAMRLRVAATVTLQVLFMPAIIATRFKG